MRQYVLLVLLLLAPCVANAGSTRDLADIAYEYRAGTALPLATVLRDDDGKTVSLSEIIDGRPLVITIGYFRCTSLCGFARANLLLALEQAHLVAGRDFSFAALSIDSSETSRDAASIKAMELETHPAFEPKNFHFLTGEPNVLTSLAESLGFKSRAMAENKLAHPLGAVFVSPSGVVSSYLLGVSYPPEELRLALRRATSGKILPAPSPLLLVCYDFDAGTGRYTFAIMKFLRLVSAATAALALAALSRVAFGDRLRT
jgi:protein SCO1/2